MRILLSVSISALVLTACASKSQSPIYQQSTGYQNSAPATQQYANAPAAVTQAGHTTTYVQDSYSQPVYSQDAYSTNASHVSTESYPVFAHPSPVLGQSSAIQAGTSAVAQNEFTFESAPAYQAPSFETPAADMDYGSQPITGTPGFLAVQGQSAPVSSPVTSYEPAPSLSSVQTASSPVYGNTAAYGAGTPVAYDISRNLITADALTTGQQPAESVRQLQGGIGQSYVVQPGDTVYSLSRRTCVGVSVIQSMNGLGADYGIKIGQALTLPAPVC